MKTQELISLTGNFNALFFMDKANVPVEAVVVMFNSYVFKDKPVNVEQIKTLIELAEPLKKNCIPKSKVKVLIKANKMFQENQQTE